MARWYVVTHCAVASAVLTAKGLVSGNPPFSTPPPQNRRPVTDRLKILQGWLRPWPLSKFGADPSMGLVGKWVKYNTNYFYLFIPLLGNSSTSQTGQWILTFDGSSARMCLLGFRPYWTPFMGSDNPKTPIFRAWIGVYQPFVPNIETSIYSKLLHRLLPNFGSDRDHQELFVGGPN